MKTQIEKVVTTLGNITVDQITKDVENLNVIDENQAVIFGRWNESLVKGDKVWYQFTPKKLPAEFIKATRDSLFIPYMNKPENLNLLGKFINKDGKAKKVDDDTFKKHDGDKLDVTANVFLHMETANLKTKGGKVIQKYVTDNRRKFDKDVWAEKIERWQIVAKTLDDNGGDVESLKKEKANRTLIEMLYWNILGDADQYSTEGYSNSLLRKVINSKDAKANAKVFEKLAKKFLLDYVNAVTLSSDDASKVIKEYTKK